MMQTSCRGRVKPKPQNFQFEKNSAFWRFFVFDVFLLVLGTKVFA
jgi:hypothetical protein